jgi:hypothetical protein
VRPAGTPLISDRGVVDLLPWLARLSDAEGGTVDEVPIDRVESGDGGSHRLTGTGRRFTALAEWRPLPEIAGWSVTLDLLLNQAEARSVARSADDSPQVAASAAVAIRAPVDGDPRWLVPGAFIGENRPAASRARYPRWVDETATAADPFTADHWWLRSDRAALPAILATGHGTRIALATTETSELGPTGVGFGTVDGRGGRLREIRLSFPYREEPVVYDGGGEPLPADRPTVAWRPGNVVRFEFQVYAVPVSSGDPREDADADREILEDVRRWLAPASAVDPGIGASEAAALAAEGLLRWHLRPGDRVLIETADFDRGNEPPGAEPGDRPGDRLAMHVAWLSGAPPAAALLDHGHRTGRREAADAGRAVLDHIAGSLAPCGSFWGQWAPGGWTKGWTAGRDAVHGRTLAEATLFLGRAARATGEPTWRAAAASNLAYVVRHERDGLVPADWDAVTGEPLSWAGTSGLAWVPPLVEASGGNGSPVAAGATGGPALLAVARRIGARHAVDVEAGFLYGSPEDVDLGPTSEDGYVAVMAYVALARAEVALARAGALAAGNGTERPPDAASRWIDLARRAADWTLGFRYGYDIAFPEGSPLAQRAFRTIGADLASPANQHLHAYGLICTADLVELSRWTGDDRYRAAAWAAFAWARQLLIRSDGDLGGRRGMMAERVFQTRYDGPKGSIGPLSHAWCLGLLLHAAEFAVADAELADD